MLGKLGTRQSNEPMEVALPEPLDVSSVTSLDSRQPLRDRFAVQHPMPSAEILVPSSSKGILPFVPQTDTTLP